MPQKSASKTTRSKKSSSSSSEKRAQTKSLSAKSSTLKAKPQEKQVKSSGLMTPFLIVCIIFAGFIGYYIADQKAIIELHKVISQCQQSFRY